jgi:hypothetical protein
VDLTRRDARYGTPLGYRRATGPTQSELRRAHRLRLAGKRERFALVPQLSAVFVQTKLLALHERRTEINEVHTRSDVGVQASQRTTLKIVPRVA